MVRSPNSRYVRIRITPVSGAQRVTLVLSVQMCHICAEFALQHSVALSYDALRADTARNQVLTDDHSPNQFRVVGSLSNSPHFAKAYQ